MAWFKRQQPDTEQKAAPAEAAEKTVKTEGLWQKCDSCREIIWKKDLETTHSVCTRCGTHFRVDARARLRMLFDDGGI